jgi:hypothetical protein
VPASASGPAFTKVIKPEVAKACILELMQHRLHPNLAGYLALKREARRLGRNDRLTSPYQEFFDTFLAVPDGPGGRPYLRPFWDQAARASQMWLNKNVAGSFAPSSLRKGVSPLLHLASIEESNGKVTYSLLPDHAELAKKHLAFAKAIPVVPLAVFLYRDVAFETDHAPAACDVVDVFRFEFGYRSDNADETSEFNALYIDDCGSRDSSAWFADVESE